VFKRSALAQYNQVKHEAQAEHATAHHLMLMLFDGAIENMGVANQAIAHSNFELKGHKLSRAIAIINGLRDCLDLEQGEIATNLDELYEYMVERLFQANYTSDQATISEVKSLLQNVREAWVQIPSEVHHLSNRK
jgi:flagellar protein FliS